MVNIKVRGLFSTGLVKLLLEKGYNIVQPSEKQKERFDINSENKPDIDIRDLTDKSGFSIIGKNPKNLINDLKDILWDSIFLKISEKSIFDGEYIRITDTPGITFSQKISKERQAEILTNIVNILPTNTGIFIKRDCPVEKIKEEILNAKPEVYEKWYVFLGYESKKILDEYRDKVLYTIPNHHVYRTSKTLTKIVDFVEILKDDKNKILSAFKEYIVQMIIDRRTIKRRHKRMQGKDLIYIEVVKDVFLSNNKIHVVTIRFPKPGKNYDGLNKPIEPGDYAITEYIEGSWFFEINYFDKNNNLKGKYININTPIEIAGTTVKYIDLIVDVVECDNRRWIVDEEEFDNIINNQNVIVSKKLIDKVEEIKNYLVKA